MDILIVEDEPAIADTLLYALDTEGFNPVWVKTGSEALSNAKDNPPALILLDIGLPDMSGFDVCKKIRSYSAVPIIFLTSRTEDIDQVLGLELGADDYITKPFSPRVLTARIRARLRQANDTFTAAGFDDDSAGLRILCRGQDLKLSRYEYRIMSALMQQPGRVFSRTQLMDIAWEEPERSFDRTVDTHIKTIRQKVHSHCPDCDSIKTHRGLGYSFQP